MDKVIAILKDPKVLAVLAALVVGGLSIALGVDVKALVCGG